MTQKQLILEYIREKGSILPAKISGQVFLGVMFGSETSKRCREMRKEGLLISYKDGKFERFTTGPVVVPYNPKDKKVAALYSRILENRLFPVDQLNYKQ